MLLYDLLYWKIKDFRYYRKNGRKLHLYGIRLVCGLYGQGKTMALTKYLSDMRDKYGDGIYISTNYGYTGEDFPLEHWKQMLTTYDKPIIFGYDEIQNEFNSRDYKNFPYELVSMLTQNRKGNGKQIVGTCQRFGRVDKVFRELCTHVSECRTFFGRLTIVRTYDCDDYNQLINTVNVNQKRKIPKKVQRFVQTDTLRDSYDSFKMLESAKVKEYQTQQEIFDKIRGV